MVAKTIADMTPDELRDMIETSVESVVEQKLYEILGDPDAGLKLRKSVRDQLLAQKREVEAGQRGRPLDDVVQELGLE